MPTMVGKEKERGKERGKGMQLKTGMPKKTLDTALRVKINIVFQNF